MNKDAYTVTKLIDQLEYAYGIDGENGSALDDVVRDGRKLAKRLGAEQPVTVEQGVLMPKSTTSPDGGSFDDVNQVGRFTGNWWGLRIRRGEPMVFQRGHVLLIRQWDLYSGAIAKSGNVCGGVVLVNELVFVPRKVVDVQLLFVR